jgi:transposase
MMISSSKCRPLNSAGRLLRMASQAYQTELTSFATHPKLLSSGVVEGLNNKAKVTMRKSYGFRTYRVLELALYHSLGKLPEPESTHDFF